MFHTVPPWMVFVPYSLLKQASWSEFAAPAGEVSLALCQQAHTDEGLLMNDDLLLKLFIFHT